MRKHKLTVVINLKGDEECHQLSQEKVVSAIFPSNTLVHNLPYFLVSVGDKRRWSWSVSVDGGLGVFGGRQDVFGGRRSVFDDRSDRSRSSICLGGSWVGAWLLVDDGVEAVVWVSGVLDGALRTVWLDQAVAALDDIALATLVLALGVTGQVILNVVGVAVRWVRVVLGVVFSNTDLGCRICNRRIFYRVSVCGHSGDSGGRGEVGGGHRRGVW